MYIFKLGIYNKENPSASLIPTKAALEELTKVINKLELDEPYIIWGQDLDVSYVGPKQLEDNDGLKEILDKLNGENK